MIFFTIPSEDPFSTPRNGKRKKRNLSLIVRIERAADKETQGVVYDVHGVFFFVPLCFLLLLAFNGNFYASEIFFFF